MKRFWTVALVGALFAASACGSAGNDVPSGGTGSNANVGGGATVVGPAPSGGTTSGQGSGSTLGSSTPIATAAR